MVLAVPGRLQPRPAVPGRAALRPLGSRSVTTWPDLVARGGQGFRGLSADRRVRPRRLQQGVPRPAGGPGRPPRGIEGLIPALRGVADARPAPAHQHRPRLFDPPRRAVPGRLHALLWADDTEGRL